MLRKRTFSDLYSLKCTSFKNKIKETKKRVLEKKCNMLGRIKRQKSEWRQKWIRYKIKSLPAIPGSIRIITGIFFLSGMFLKGKKHDSQGRVTQKAKRKTAGRGPWFTIHHKMRFCFCFSKAIVFFQVDIGFYLHKVNYNEETEDMRTRSRHIT